MNIDNAQRHIRNILDDALTEPVAATLASDASFMDRHTGALIHQVSVADPDGRDDEAAATAMTEYAQTLRTELRATHPHDYHEED